MKKIYIAIFALFFFTAPVVLAQAPASRSAVRQDAVMSRLKTRADNEITRRVAALTRLLGRITEMKRVSSDQKTTLTSQVQEQIDALNTLKTKIDADGDIATLRADVQSIVKSYRIFALYIPKMYIIAHADRLLDVIEDLTAISEKLKARGGSATLLADMTAKLTAAKTQAQNAIAAVTPLVPDGYPGNKTTLQSARTMLVTARADIQAAHKDGQQIRQALAATPKL